MYEFFIENPSSYIQDLENQYNTKQLMYELRDHRTGITNISKGETHYRRLVSNGLHTRKRSNSRNIPQSKIWTNGRYKTICRSISKINKVGVFEDR